MDRRGTTATGTFSKRKFKPVLSSEAEEERDGDTAGGPMWPD